MKSCVIHIDMEKGLLQNGEVLQQPLFAVGGKNLSDRFETEFRERFGFRPFLSDLFLEMIPLKAGKRPYNGLCGKMQGEDNPKALCPEIGA